MWTAFENWTCEKKDYYEHKAALGRPSLLPRELLFQLRKWKDITLMFEAKLRDVQKDQHTIFISSWTANNNNGNFGDWMCNRISEMWRNCRRCLKPYIYYTRQAKKTRDLGDPKQNLLIDFKWRERLGNVNTSKNWKNRFWNQDLCNLIKKYE